MVWKTRSSACLMLLWKSYSLSSYFARIMLVQTLHWEYRKKELERTKGNNLDPTKQSSTQTPPEGLHEYTCPAELSLLKSALNNTETRCLQAALGRWLWCVTHLNLLGAPQLRCSLQWTPWTSPTGPCLPWDFWTLVSALTKAQKQTSMNILSSGHVKRAS